MSNMSDSELRAHSLLLWANHIETGDVSLSGGDLHAMGRTKQLKRLTEDQQALVIRLRALSRVERQRQA